MSDMSNKVNAMEILEKLSRLKLVEQTEKRKIKGEENRKKIRKLDDITDTRMKLRMIKLQMKMRQLKAKNKKTLKLSRSQMIMMLEKEQEEIKKYCSSLTEELVRIERKKMAEEKRERMRQEKEKIRLTKAKIKAEQDEKNTLIKKIRSAQKDLEFRIERVQNELLNNDAALCYALKNTKSDFEKDCYILKTKFAVPIHELMGTDWYNESKSKLQTLEHRQQQNAEKLFKLQKIKQRGESLPTDFEKFANAKLWQIWSEKMKLFNEVE